MQENRQSNLSASPVHVCAQILEAGIGQKRDHPVAQFKPFGPNPVVVGYQEVHLVEYIAGV